MSTSTSPSRENMNIKMMQIVVVLKQILPYYTIFLVMVAFIDAKYYLGLFVEVTKSIERLVDNCMNCTTVYNSYKDGLPNSEEVEQGRLMIASYFDMFLLLINVWIYLNWVEKNQTWFKPKCDVITTLAVIVFISVSVSISIVNQMKQLVINSEEITLFYKLSASICFLFFFMPILLIVICVIGSLIMKARELRHNVIHA